MSMDQALPVGHRPAEHRIERQCESCGQWDKAPRHIHTDDKGRDHLKHLDCCAADGCPAPGDHAAACHNLLARHGHVKNDELVAALRGMGPLEFCPDEHEARRQHRLRADITDEHLTAFLQGAAAAQPQEG
jgi:hypothetical protein